MDDNGGMDVVICNKITRGWEHPRDWLDLWNMDPHQLHHEAIRLRMFVERLGFDPISLSPR